MSDPTDDIGDNLTADPMTMHGRGWPCLRQFSVFMENRVGKLHNLFKQFERQDLRIIALSVHDSVDFSTVRIMFDNTDRARELFQLSRFTVIEKDVVGVVLPDDPQPLLRIALALMEFELNIQYAYPLLFRRGGKGAIAICVDEVDTAMEMLRERGHTIITESDLADDDEYF